MPPGLIFERENKAENTERVFLDKPCCGEYYKRYGIWNPGDLNYKGGNRMDAGGTSGATGDRSCGRIGIGASVSVLL